jgi:hypothetical protein
VIDKRIIIPGKVLNVDDPLMLGRIRVLPQIENEQQGEPDQKELWTKKDPFVCQPLIPYYISQVPKVGEYVHVMYSTRDEIKDWNKFYIQGPLTRPWNNPLESYNNSKAMLASGDFIQQAPNIRNTSTGVVEEGLVGVYPLPGDNAFLGRGSTDLLIKSEDVIMRAGKYSVTPGVEKPRYNNYRSWVQLSNYTLEKVKEGTEVLEYEVYKDIEVKNFIEWSIENINVTGNTVDGYVRTNSVVPNAKTTTVSTFNLQSGTTINCIPISGSQMNFTGFSVTQASRFISQYIKGYNRGKVVINGYNDFPNIGNLTQQFPFVFGPNLNTYQKYLSDDPQISNFVILVYNNVKLNEANNEAGFATVWSKNTVGPQTVTQTQVVDKSKYLEKPVTYASVGGDYLYFLSHKSDNPKRNPFNLNNTLYGIPQEKFTDDIQPNTSSMVRGEELMELIGLIVTFLASHVHQPNEAPIQEPKDTVTISQISELLNNAEKNILNPYIRIN